MVAVGAAIAIAGAGATLALAPYHGQTTRRSNRAVAASSGVGRPTCQRAWPVSASVTCATDAWCGWLGEVDGTSAAITTSTAVAASSASDGRAVVTSGAYAVAASPISTAVAARLAAPSES